MSVRTYSYKKNGDMSLSEHFCVKEFASICGSKLYSDKVKIETKLIEVLEKLFKDLNCSKIVITSGYRTSAHEKAVAGRTTGPHTTGKAADFICYDKKGLIISAKTVCLKLEDYANVWGIGYISERAVHIDMNYRTRLTKWWGDETKSGQRGIQYYKKGCTSFYDYWGIKKETQKKTTSCSYKVGQTVEFKYCFKTSTDKYAKRINAKNMIRNYGKITKIYKGKANPYLLDNGLCFVNKKSIAKVK